MLGAQQAGQGVVGAEGAAFNTWAVFAISYTTGTVKLSRVDVLLAVTAGALLMAVVAPIAGWLGDRYGRRPVFGTGVALFGISVLPSFYALRSGSTALMVVVLVTQLGICYGLMAGAEAALLAVLAMRWWMPRDRGDYLTQNPASTGSVTPVT